MSVIKEWNRLDLLFETKTVLLYLKKCFLNFIKPLPNKVLNPHNRQVLKHLTRRRLGVSHPRDHKFKYNFWDTINLSCSCDSNAKRPLILLLYCPTFLEEKTPLLNEVLTCTDSKINDALLFDNILFNQFDSNRIFNITITFIVLSKRPNGPLFCFFIVWENGLQAICFKS